MEKTNEQAHEHPAKVQAIKCVVWDLDNTLWHGVLLEGDPVSLHPAVTDVIKTLDSRGILNSIASKNDYSTAMAKLQEIGLAEYFLYPQINWNAKSISLQAIASSLNLGQDALAFIDDQEFERDEVKFALPAVLCLDITCFDTLLALPQMNPRFQTVEGRQRRMAYIKDRERNQAEKEFKGTNADFLASLQMVLTISPATENDLQRAEELTMRTHQLNSTGYTYSYEELAAFSQSPSHRLLVASLTDKYGPYGKIGLALIECGPDIWTLKLLLMSCRVISRGVGVILLNAIVRLARQAGVRLQAEFVTTERNRIMHVTYMFNGFKQIRRSDDFLLLEHNQETFQTFPPYMQVIDTCYDGE